MSMIVESASLESKMYSTFPLLRIESDEELRILDLLSKTVAKVGKPLATWSIASGLRTGKGGQFGTLNSAYPTIEYNTGTDLFSPEDALDYINKQLTDTAIVLLDFHPFLEKARVVRLLKEAAFNCASNGNKIILLSHAINIPLELNKLTETFDVQLPTIDLIRDLVEQEVALFKIKRQHKSLQVDETAKQMLIQNLVGVSLSDADRLIKNAIYIDDAITESDIPVVQKAKYSLISKSGAITFEYDTASFDQVGGFNNLKNWINDRKETIVANNATGQDAVDRPKGVLLLGVQGCGKSLAARAISGQLGIPLLRLDIGALYNKYIGESERNIRDALQVAKVMSPCVLWIDEIEKGISGVDDNTGASSRVLATLLSWMQENKSGSFLIATANDITALPPELIRKGRIDEIFFVDLPTYDIRKNILQTVLHKRNLSVVQYDLDALSQSCEGFSGAEIEQAVVSAIYRQSGFQQALDTDAIIAEMIHTKPLSVVRKEEVQQLRLWAKDRTVSVDGAEMNQLGVFDAAS